MEFENKTAERAWRLKDGAAHIAARLSAEPDDDKMQLISFKHRQKTRGLQVVYTSGVVVGTTNENVFNVPNRTLRILGQMGISFSLSNIH